MTTMNKLAQELRTNVTAEIEKVEVTDETSAEARAQLYADAGVRATLQTLSENESVQQVYRDEEQDDILELSSSLLLDQYFADVNN